MAQLSGSTILVVEDEELVLMDFVSALWEAGAEVVGARNLAEAQCSLHRHYDVAVLDLMIGRETSQGIMKQLAEAGTPMILVSGASSARAVTLNFARSIAIQKPVQAATLISAVVAMLGPLDNSGNVVA